MAFKEWRQSTEDFIIRWVSRKIVFPVMFFIGSRRPIKENKVVFLELRLLSLSNNHKELYKRLTEDYDMDVKCVFFRIGTDRRREIYKHYSEYIWEASDAKYLIFSEGNDVHACVPKRKGQHQLNTWHAAGAFKRFGLSTATKLFGDTADNMKRFPSHGNYDLVTVSSPEIEWAYIEAMGKEKDPECIKAVGLSRTDVFYKDGEKREAFERFYKQFPEAKGKKVILYAPTFRGKTVGAETPDKLSVEKFYERLGDEYVLVFKHHPIVHKRPAIPEKYSSFAKDLSDSMTIEDLLFVSDICISDYSSLIYEYSLFEKPMIFFAYDLDDYFDWRGFYYNYDELTPGPVYKTNEEILDYIENIDERFDKEEVRKFKERFMSACDGHATDRIMKMFFEPSLEKYKKKEK